MSPSDRNSDPTLPKEAFTILEWLADHQGNPDEGIPGGARLLIADSELCTEAGKDLLRILDSYGLVEFQVFHASGGGGRSPWFSPTGNVGRQQSLEQIIDDSRKIIEGLNSGPMEILVDGMIQKFSGRGFLQSFAPWLRITEQGRVILARSKMISEQQETVTTYDRAIEWLKNNKIVAIVIVVATIIIASAALLDAGATIMRFFGLESTDAVVTLRAADST